MTEVDRSAVSSRIDDQLANDIKTWLSNLKSELKAKKDQAWEQLELSMKERDGYRRKSGFVSGAFAMLYHCRVITAKSAYHSNNTPYQAASYAYTEASLGNFEPAIQLISQYHENNCDPARCGIYLRTSDCFLMYNSLRMMLEEINTETGSILDRVKALA